MVDDVVLWTVLLIGLTLGFFTLPLLPAFVEWYRKTDAEPLQVVRERDTNVRQFAQSFRNQLLTLFAKYGINPLQPLDSFQGFWRQDDTFYFIGPNRAPRFSAEEQASRRVRQLVVSCSDLRLPDDMVFEQEVYAGGALYCGQASTFRAIYSDRRIEIAEDCAVARWGHGTELVRAASRCRLLGRLTSDRRVIIGAGVQFERMHAPVIVTGVEFQPPSFLPIRREPWKPPAAGITLDTGTLLFTDSITIPAAQIVRDQLVSKGTLTIGENSKMYGSLKAYRLLRIGRRSIVRGALVCHGKIHIEEGCAIAGPIIAEDSVYISSGCMIGTRTLQTTVTAPRIILSTGVCLSGTVWATREGGVQLAGIASDYSRSVAGG